MEERVRNWKIANLKRKIGLAENRLEWYTLPNSYGHQKEIRTIDEKRATEIIKRYERELKKLIKQ